VAEAAVAAVKFRGSVRRDQRSSSLPWATLTVSADELWVRRPTVEPVHVLRTDGASVGWARGRFSLRIYVLLLDEDGRRIFDWAFLPLRPRRLRRTLTTLDWPLAHRPDLTRTWGR